MTKLEIIDFVVTHFTTHDRSFVPIQGCVYNGQNGEHCAFALMCEQPESLPEGRCASACLSHGVILKPQFVGFKDTFYDDIQLLHDRDYFWISLKGEGLSAVGLEHVATLKKQYK